MKILFLNKPHRAKKCHWCRLIKKGGYIGSVLALENQGKCLESDENQLKLNLYFIYIDESVQQMKVQ